MPTQTYPWSAGVNGMNFSQFIPLRTGLWLFFALEVGSCVMHTRIMHTWRIAFEVESCIMHTCIMHTSRIAFEVESCKMHTCIMHTSRKAAFLSSLNSWPVQMHTGLETTFVPTTFSTRWSCSLRVTDCYKQAPFVNDSI